MFSQNLVLNLPNAPMAICSAGTDFFIADNYNLIQRVSLHSAGKRRVLHQFHVFGLRVLALEYIGATDSLASLEQCEIMDGNLQQVRYYCEHTCLWIL